jgi:hypothetical protein
VTIYGVMAHGDRDMEGCCCCWYVVCSGSTAARLFVCAEGDVWGVGDVSSPSLFFVRPFGTSAEGRSSFSTYTNGERLSTYSGYIILDDSRCKLENGRTESVNKKV